jgi:hypothetical protein
MVSVNAFFFALTMMFVALLVVEAQSNLENGLALAKAEIALRTQPSVATTPFLRHAGLHAR